MKTTSNKTEIIAGLTTFFTMSYALIVVPSILSTPGTGIPFQSVLTGTVLLSIIGTFLMGFGAKLPYGVAPGLGMTAFFTFTLILEHQIPYATALGMVFWAGVFFVLISLTPIRALIAKGIPLHLRASIAVGIGLFITFIGLKNCGLVISHPSTFVQPGPLTFESISALVGICIALYLLKKGQPLAFLITIFLITLASIVAGKISIPSKFISLPSFEGAFFSLDIFSSLDKKYFSQILSLFFTAFFDSLSTFMALAQGAKMLDKDQQPIRLKQGLLVDAFSSLAASFTGTSPGTVYLESASGVQAGGRRGLTALVVATLFIPCLFLTPLLSLVPLYATAPILILVGGLMFAQVKEIPLKDLEKCIPSFLIIIFIPLTFSITQGILWGFISHLVFYLILGKRKEIHPAMVVIALLCLILVFIENMN